MKLSKENLLELQDYVNSLDEQVGLDADTVNDITKAIDKQLYKLSQQDSLISHIDGIADDWKFTDPY